MSKIQELPKWFNGEVYACGDEVTNPFSGDSYVLNNKELSMYDFIMGCVMLGKQDNTFLKAITWFRMANPSAYMVLLDQSTDQIRNTIDNINVTNKNNNNEITYTKQQAEKNQ